MSSCPRAGTRQAHARYRRVSAPLTRTTAGGLWRAWGSQSSVPLTVDGSGRLGPRDRVVLAALATRLGQPVSADQLSDARLGRPPSGVGRQEPAGLRGPAPQGAGARRRSRRRPHGYALRRAPRRRRRAAVRGAGQPGPRAARRSARPTGRRTCWSEALALWRGAAFADLESWQPARRGRHAAGRAAPGGRGAAGRRAAAQPGGTARSSPRRRPWCAPRRCGSAAGSCWPARSTSPAQQGEALRTIHQLRAVLAEQLGIDPGPGRGRPGAVDPAAGPSLARARAPRAVRPPCPWLGLRPYDVEDADGSSAGTTTWPPAWRSWRGARCSPWSGRPARASPRCSGPGVAGSPATSRPPSRH